MTENYKNTYLPYKKAKNPKQICLILQISSLVVTIGFTSKFILNMEQKTPPERPDRAYTVADAILDVLIAHGVTHIFGYPGGAILPFYDALPYHPKIKHVLTRHEQGAAFMAQGWARSTKQLGVCCATSGPGATNLVTGIADAMLDSIPILCITGQVPLQMIGKDMFQEADMTGVTLSITKHNYLLDDPVKAVYTVTEAIKLALSGRPGPIHIDVPKDIMASPHPREFEIPLVDLVETDSHKEAYLGLDSHVIQAIIEALNEAKKPILLIGQGIKLANAEPELQSFVERLGIPTVNTILAKGILSPEHSCYLGMLGMHGYYHANMAMHEADLIINIGSRFDDRIVGRYDIFAENAKVIHVDVDKAELNKVVAADIAVHSDALQFLKQILEHPLLAKLQIEPWWQQIKLWQKDKPYKEETEIFSMRNVLKQLNEIVKADPDKFVIAVDVGQHQMWSALSCEIENSKAWLSSSGAGTMGFSLPAAIGAAFANPDKTVITISGDGGFQMNMQELAVIKDYDLNVKVLILNNNYLGMVRQWQELFYENNYSAVEISSPDYIKIADAYALPATRINNEADLVKLKNELTNKGPILIECVVEKEDNVFPMVPGGKHLGQTLTE